MKAVLKSHLAQSVLCVSLVFLLICGLIMSNILTVGGTYKVREVKIQYDGYTLQGTLFIPKASLQKDEEYSAATTGNNINKVPAIVMQGGGSANRYIMYSHVEEFIKRGFVVFAIDAYTHGMSENYPEGWGVYSQVHDAIRYVHSLNFVDDTQVGYMGHSQGGSATMMALSKYSGYYTSEDLLYNMLHDELGVTLNEEQIAAQNADVIAAELDDYAKGYYDSRKEEILTEYYENRISFGIILGMATGAAPPISSGEFNNVNPTVVDVGGVSVMRNVQADICVIVSQSDESMGMNALNAMQMTRTDELPISPLTRAFFATGKDEVQLDTLYRVNISANDENVPSDILGSFKIDSIEDEQVQEASQDASLRMLTMYPGWHNTNHYSQKDIETSVNFAVLATGFNNGYLSETGGTNAADFYDTQTWKVAYACNVVAFFALIAMVVSFTITLFRTRTFENTVCVPIKPQVSKKSLINWMFMVFVVVLPVLLITPLMNHCPIQASWFAKFDRIVPIAFWSLACAAILLVLMIVKWNVYDKKNTKIKKRTKKCKRKT